MKPEVYAKSYGEGKFIVTGYKEKGSIGADLLITKSTKSYKPGSIVPQSDVVHIGDAKFGKNTKLSADRIQKFQEVFGQVPEIITP